MLYSIAIFPSEPIQYYANQYRRRYDPKYALIEPHLTLHETKEWTDEQLKSVKTHLYDVTRACRPLEVCFNRFSTFYPVSNVIFMALMDSDPIRKLYHMLCGGIPEEPNKPYIYTPHVTVAQCLGDDELHDVFSSLKQETLDFCCTINQVELLQQSDNGRWNCVEAFPLLVQ